MAVEDGSEARREIQEKVTDYYRQFKENKKDFVPGDRIAYASRVYDEKEMCALTDAMLDFWLTAGRFSRQFEKDFAEFLGVKYAHLVNSGSSANLLAFMVLTAPELGDQPDPAGDEVITVACGFPTTVAPDSCSMVPFRSFWMWTFLSTIWMWQSWKRRCPRAQKRS